MVSVIIVNWNGKSYLGECLNYLRNWAFLDFEVVVVDNDSESAEAYISALQVLSKMSRKRKEMKRLTPVNKEEILS